VCNVLSTLSQKLRNCVTSPLNFANVIFGSLYFDVHGVETVKLGCSKDADESRDIEAFAKGNVESGVINLMLEMSMLKLVQLKSCSMSMFLARSKSFDRETCWTQLI